MALSSFSRLNEIVSVRSPASDTPPSVEGLLPSRFNKSLTAAAPQTILLLSWGDASARYIEKYTSLYTELFPGAEMILVRSGMVDFFFRSEETQQKLVEPAVKILRESAEDTLLVHVMSNAGSKQWCTINKSYYQSTGRALSNAVTIVDSAPGRSRFKQAWAALSRSLPRAFLPRMALGFISSIALSIMFLAKHILSGPDILEVVREQMNDPTATKKGARRFYIYSEEDDLIGSEDVEEHAMDAEQKGWVVELVKFQGSIHVGHLKQNPERYRETIKKAWLGGPE